MACWSKQHAVRRCIYSYSNGECAYALSLTNTEYDLICWSCCYSRVCVSLYLSQCVMCCGLCSAPSLGIDGVSTICQQKSRSMRSLFPHFWFVQPKVKQKDTISSNMFVVSIQYKSVPTLPFHASKAKSELFPYKHLCGRRLGIPPLRGLALEKTFTDNTTPPNAPTFGGVVRNRRVRGRIQILPKVLFPLSSPVRYSLVF